MSSNPNPSPNRNKVLLGFSAVVAVLIVAILLWPANVRKEDASGAIGAVQKHRAPQIAQQDVVLGGESVKAQQKLLYTDFREDAGKLRALANGENAAARQQFARDLQMRAVRTANEAVAAAKIMNVQQAADLELLARKLNEEAQLSDVELNQLALRLGALAETEQAAMARVASASQAFSQIQLNDEQLAAQRIKDVEAAVSNLDRDMELFAQSHYLGALAEEVALMSRGGQAADFEVLARKLESNAKANEEMFVNEEVQLGTRLSDVDSMVASRYSSASMVNSRYYGEIQQASSRIQARANLAKTMSRSTLGALNARSN